MQEKTEMTRKLIELAIASGRHYQSSQTGFLHYCHTHANELVHHTIPIYDNALFALALLRSRLVENIREAQNLLTRLLAFQTEEGNFPFYLHDYPWSNNFSLAVQLMTPFHWILKFFGHILGQELRTALETSIQKLVVYILQITEVKKFPSALSLRLAAGLIAFGRHLKNEKWQKTGELLLAEELKQMNPESWLNTQQIADILIALSLLKDDYQQDYWKDFIKFIAQTWQAKLAAYCGPCIHEHQSQFYPVLNLYDLYMGFLTGHLDIHTNQTSIEMLAGSLIYPIGELGTKLASEVSFCEGKYKNVNWMCLNQENWALSLIEKNVELEEKIQKTYTPFRFIWGEETSKPHSLVCQGGNAKRIEYKWQEPIVEIYFDLDIFKGNDYESSREVCFFLDIHPDVVIEVENQRTSVFELNQTVQIKLKDGKSLQMSFEILEGEGNFLGHIAQSNRSSQLKQADLKKLQVYDWKIFVRTLRRSANCKIKVKIELSLN